MSEHIDFQWTYRKNFMSMKVLGFLLYVSVCFGLMSMTLGFCLPVHVGIEWHCRPFRAFFNAGRAHVRRSTPPCVATVEVAGQVTATSRS